MTPGIPLPSLKHVCQFLQEERETLRSRGALIKEEKRARVTLGRNQSNLSFRLKEPHSRVGEKADASPGGKRSLVQSKPDIVHGM